MNGHCDPQVTENKEENHSNEERKQSTLRKHIYLCLKKKKK